MKASEQDVSIIRYNKRTKHILFNVCGDPVSLKLSRLGELITPRVALSSRFTTQTLDVLEDYFSRIGLLRYGTNMYRFPSFMTAAALKLYLTFKRAGTVGLDTFNSVSAVVDDYRVPAEVKFDLDASYIRFYDKEGNRAVELYADSGTTEVSVIFRAGYKPLFNVPREQDAKLIKGLLAAAIDVYKEVHEEPISDEWVDVATDDYFKDIFYYLKPTNKPEFNMEEPVVDIEPRRDAPTYEHTVDIGGLLSTAKTVMAHLPIAMCVNRATLKYNELYYTIGAMTGFSSDSECTVLRTQFYRKRPVERDNKTPMHLSIAVQYGVVTLTEPENAKVVSCDGMSSEEFAKLLGQYADLLRN